MNFKFFHEKIAVLYGKRRARLCILITLSLFGAALSENRYSAFMAVLSVFCLDMMTNAYIKLDLPGISWISVYTHEENKEFVDFGLGTVFYCLNVIAAMYLYWASVSGS